MIGDAHAARYVRGMHGDIPPAAHRVVCLPRGRTFACADGETLLEAAWRADVPLASSCGGQGVCGDCVVRVVDGLVDVAEPDAVEQAWRLRRDAAACERLACRMTLRGGVVVSTTYW